MWRKACHDLWVVCGLGITLAMFMSPMTEASVTTIVVDENFRGATKTMVEITLDDEVDPGKVTITTAVLGSGKADIRGVFFHLADESLLAGLTVVGDDVTGLQAEADDVHNLGRGANLNGGGNANHGPFDVGVEIGTPGAGKDMIDETVFVLSHPDPQVPLTISLFNDQWFGVRLTSVIGAPGGNSNKLQGFSVVPEPGSMLLLLAGAASILGRRHV